MTFEELTRLGPLPRQAGTRRMLGDALLRGVLICRECSREAGELIGSAQRSWLEARFFRHSGGTLPHWAHGKPRCGRCAGAMCVDDVEQLAPSVRLYEIEGRPLWAYVVAPSSRSADSRTPERVAC